MTAITPAGATIPGVTHHLADVNGARLHYVSAGTGGSPVLLAHGWPETWWAFRKLIPLLAETHRVFALDLHHLVQHLGVGPVHFSCQDISGGLGFSFAATHPDDVRSLIAIETTLAGYGLESLGDVAHGGSWHVGFLGTPGIPTMLLPGRERDLLARWAYPMMTAVKGSVAKGDLDEITRPEHVDNS